ncbi:MAG: hypothetical protein ACTSPQ_22670, partial [Candidatus Helarchaeota archaeon]
MDFKNRYINYAYRRFLKPLLIKEKDFISSRSSNLFLSGISGRTGTTWVMRLIGDLLDHLKYTSIGESGFF